MPWMQSATSHGDGGSGQSRTSGHSDKEHCFALRGTHFVNQFGMTIIATHLYSLARTSEKEAVPSLREEFKALPPWARLMYDKGIKSMRSITPNHPL
mmetsp:Transcript_4364/g.12663  ORF Transcript_4364/g.12663 Transcript_4364/m.12663 type:complete len:97 (-) Transcript_4364:697-987(-)